MKIVQIIDSLEAGGAEKMAVNYANALVTKASFSGLVATRKEGFLKNQLLPEVSYLFLNKKHALDFFTVYKLRKFCLDNKVAILQAHGSSFFLAVLVKMVYPKIKIIWQDHYGISQDLNKRSAIVLQFCSPFFSGIIAVNQCLKNWATKKLWCKRVAFLPNFYSESTTSKEKIKLHGLDGKRIICVANFRPQKNHLLLIAAAKDIVMKHPDWSFHLVGKSFDDAYFTSVTDQIEVCNLQKSVYVYKATPAIGSALQQSDIGVLSSLSEGFPLAILEYGQHGLPVIATNVGDVKVIIKDATFGICIDSGNQKQLVDALLVVIENSEVRYKLGKNLKKLLEENYSEASVLKQYKQFLKEAIYTT